MSSTNDQVKQSDTQPTEQANKGNGGATEQRPSEVPQPSTPRKGAEETEMNKEGSPVAQQHNKVQEPNTKSSVKAPAEDDADRAAAMADKNTDRITNREGTKH